MNSVMVFPELVVRHVSQTTAVSPLVELPLPDLLLEFGSSVSDVVALVGGGDCGVFFHGLTKTCFPVENLFPELLFGVRKEKSVEEGF